jgi:hypothetical protein
MIGVAHAAASKGSRMNNQIGSAGLFCDPGVPSCIQV